MFALKKILSLPYYIVNITTTDQHTAICGHAYQSRDQQPPLRQVRPSIRQQQLQKPPSCRRWGGRPRCRKSSQK